MNKTLTILSIMIVLLFAGCKKDKQEFNKNIVRIVTLPLDQSNVLKTAQGNGILLQGAIISPSVVEVKDHGFIINDFPNIAYRRLGATTKLGHFEATYETMTSIFDYMLVAYLVFPNGDSLRSDRPGIISGTQPPPTTISPNAFLSGFSIDPIEPGYTALSLSTFWDQSTGYYIQSETLYFKDSSNSTWSSYPLPVNPNLSNYSLNANVPSLAGAGGYTYDFRVEVVMYPGALGGNPVTISTPIVTVLYQ